MALGVPELATAALIVALIVPAILWVRADPFTHWESIAGRVVTGEVQDTHFNSTQERLKVNLVYEYTIDGDIFTGQHTGFWPQIYSPNALGNHQLASLENPGTPLTVLYDPAKPFISSLHYGGSRKPLYTLFFATALAIAAYYLLKVYPRIRHVR
jgi:hypothetical protein